MLYLGQSSWDLCGYVWLKEASLGKMQSTRSDIGVPQRLDMLSVALINFAFGTHEWPIGNITNSAFLANLTNVFESCAVS